MIHRLDITDCDIWFMRFSLALGNQKGKTYIYDLETSDPAQIKSSVLYNPKCTAAVRQTALSRDGDVLICVCDDGTVWRWDANVASNEN
jgi:polycomb protein EED